MGRPGDILWNARNRRALGRVSALSLGLGLLLFGALLGGAFALVGYATGAEGAHLRNWLVLWAAAWLPLAVCLVFLNLGERRA